MKKKKILLILTGGTFGMAEGPKENVLTTTGLDGKNIIDAVPEVKQLADLDWVSIFNLDSSDVSPTHWENIANTIKDKYADYDGFVVIHGTDTMVYSATAISFIMKHTEKPVIFTGSQRPLSKIRTDARDNFINSVEFATMDIPEVAICFGDELLRGNRSKKISIDEYKAFKTYNYPTLAKVGVNIELRNMHFRKAQTPEWNFGFNTNIALLKIFPGMSADLLKDSLISGRVKGVILEGFGSGNLPEFDESWLNLIAELKKLMVPTVITSQCPQGMVNLKAYEHGIKAVHKGAISCGGITTESAVVKLMFALERCEYYNDIVDFMRKNYCDEM